MIMYDMFRPMAAADGVGERLRATAAATCGRRTPECSTAVRSMALESS